MKSVSTVDPKWNTVAAKWQSSRTRAPLKRFVIIIIIIIILYFIFLTQDVSPRISKITKIASSWRDH